MFVFSATLSAGLWFVVRFAYRRLFGWGPRAFWVVTLTAAVFASVGLGTAMTAALGRAAGLYVGALALPVYVGIVLALRSLLRAFGGESDLSGER